MHELSVCQALIGQVEAVARERGASSVKSVCVRIGPLASTGTVAEDSGLLIEAAPLTVKCESCGAQTEAVPNRLTCAACGDYHIQLISGDELMLRRAGGLSHRKRANAVEQGQKRF